MKYSLPIECEKIKDFPKDMQPLARKVFRIGRAYVKAKYDEEFSPLWPEKLTEIILTTKGKKYRIPYRVFNIDSEDQAMIYSLRDHLLKELSVELENAETELDADGFMD